MKRLLLILGFFLAISSNLVWGTGEPATYFNIYLPPNNDKVGRNVCLIVTAIYDSTSFEIIDDGMDGDTDDTKSGILMAGQSYVLYIRDNGVNDDAPMSGETTTKQDGDYFIIKSNNLVFASQSTNSDWQHDWVPSVNKSSLGQRFIVYAPKTTSNNVDMNIMAYQDSTYVVVRKISTANKTTSGVTTVNMDNPVDVGSQMIHVGEDLIYKYTLGRNIFISGETYLIETSKPVTMQYGALFGNERDGGGYVPSSNGSSAGSQFYFTVPYQVAGEQEIRVVSWSDNNAIQLDRYSNGSWIPLKTWTLNKMAGGDWVGKSSGNVTYPTVFRLSCSAGKKVSVFEANWLETGAPGTSDIATMMSSENGNTAGTKFLAYMAPPGYENNVTNPFTGLKIGTATHAYIFARDTAHVTVKDAYTNGQEISRTYTILPDRYVDCSLSLNEWQAIYNGNGTASAGPERPYLLIESDNPVSVMNTNFNDNWMMYFGSSAVQSFKQTSNSSQNLIIPGDTIKVVSSIIVDGSSPITDTEIKVEISSGLTPITSILENQTTNSVSYGTISTSATGSTITFQNEPSILPSDQFTVTTQIVAQVNYDNGTPIAPNTVAGIQTIVSGNIDGDFQQSVSSENIQLNAGNTSNLLFSKVSIGNIATDLTNSWSANWIDYNNDGWEDLFVAQYSKDKANLLYKNNGNGTFSSITSGELVTKKMGTVSSSWADIDNDGDIDAVIANNGSEKNALYLNNGDGSFSKKADPGDLANSPGYFHGAAFADFDNDGLVDVFVSNYMPTKYHLLLKNKGDGTFENLNQGMISLETGYSVGASWADVNNDGYQDLFIPNGRGEKNAMFLNRGNGAFEKIQSGAISQDVANSVGGCWGDYDGDNDLDLYVTNASKQANFLYNNDGNGIFTKVSSGALTSSKFDSHGCAWVDIDNDSDLDLYVTNDRGQKKNLFINDGIGGFYEQINDPLLSAVGNTFANVWADFDKDGDQDVFVATHSNEKNMLFTNNGADNNWINFKCIGTESNKSAIGTRVQIDCNGKKQIREINAQSGIGGQSSLRVHFGLGNATTIDTVRVFWPSGHVQVLTNVLVNNFMTITEENTIRVSGKVFNDGNQNCTLDQHEIGVAGIKVSLGNGISAYTDNNGQYTARLKSGTHMINAASQSGWSSTCPMNQVVVGNMEILSNNIPIHAVQEHVLMSVHAGANAHRRGFRSSIKINYRNSGTSTSLNDTIRLTIDPRFVVISASMNWESKQGNTYSWCIPQTKAGEEGFIEIIDSVSLASAVGQNIPITVKITEKANDPIMSDNTFAWEEKIVGAIDPNEITVSPEGEGTEGFVRKKDVLVYKISFENIGTYMASRVVIKSTLPEHIDPTTLIEGVSSHKYCFRIEGDDQLVWEFDGINLPDTSVSKTESQGYVTFKVQPKASVNGGDIIENQAKIVFDYEEPIVTNKTKNTIKYTDGIGTLITYPNPSNGLISLKAKIDDPSFEDPKLVSVSISNPLGEIVGVYALTNPSIELPQILENQGVYFLTATDAIGNRYVGKITFVK